MNEDSRKQVEDLLKQAYEKALSLIKNQGDLVSSDITPDELTSVIDQIDSITDKLKDFLRIKSEILQKINEQIDYEISSKIEDYFNSEFNIGFSEEMERFTAFKSDLGSEVSNDKLRECIFSISDVDAFKKNAFLSLLDSNKDNYSLSLLASNVHQSNEAMLQGDWQAYGRHVSERGKLIAECPDNSALISGILENPEIILNKDLQNGQSDSLGEAAPVFKKTVDEVQNVDTKVVENVEPFSLSQDVSQWLDESQKKFDFGQGFDDAEAAEPVPVSSNPLFPEVEGSDDIIANALPGADRTVFTSGLDGEGISKGASTGDGTVVSDQSQDNSSLIQSDSPSEKSPLTPKSGEKLSRPSFEGVDVGTSEAGISTSEFVPEPISWEDIWKMKLDGKTQYRIERTFGNEYPMFKVKDGKIGEFVEYGKTPNGDLILIPNPKYYTGEQPLLNNGLTIFSFLFDYENKYAYGNTMEIIPAVIHNFDADKVFPRDVLVTKGGFRHIKKDNVISDVGNQAEKFIRDEHRLSNDGVSETFDAEVFEEFTTINDRDLHKIAVYLTEICVYTASEDEIAYVEDFIRDFANKVRTESNYSDWALENLAQRGINGESVEMYLATSIAQDYAFCSSAFDHNCSFNQLKEHLNRCATNIINRVRFFEKSKSSYIRYPRRSVFRAYLAIPMSDPNREDSDYVDMVRQKIDYALQRIRRCDALYMEFILKCYRVLGRSDNIISEFFERVLKEEYGYVDPKKINDDIIEEVVNRYNDFMNDCLDKAYDGQYYSYYDRLDEFSGDSPKISEDEIESLGIPGEPYDPCKQYRIAAMRFLGFTKVDRNNIRIILSEEARICDDVDCLMSGFYDGFSVPKKEYDSKLSEIQEDICEYYKEHDTKLHRIVRKVKEFISQKEHERIERALAKKEEKMRKKQKRQQKQELLATDEIKRAGRIQELQDMKQEVLEVQRENQQVSYDTSEMPGRHIKN